MFVSPARFPKADSIPVGLNMTFFVEDLQKSWSINDLNDILGREKYFCFLSLYWFILIWKFIVIRSFLVKNSQIVLDSEIMANIQHTFKY